MDFINPFRNSRKRGINMYNDFKQISDEFEYISNDITKNINKILEKNDNIKSKVTIFPSSIIVKIKSASDLIDTTIDTDILLELNKYLGVPARISSKKGFIYLMWGDNDDLL